MSDQPVTADGFAAQVMRLAEQVRPLLAGQPPEVVGAALADLLAIWLAAHVVFGNERATRRQRRNLLVSHIDSVMRLMEINARMMGTTGEGMQH